MFRFLSKNEFAEKNATILSSILDEPRKTCKKQKYGRSRKIYVAWDHVGQSKNKLKTESI